ncbi:TVP38/TMEM64 family protein [Mycolicibacterium brumae]|uniref:TVP38/TMEM64 family membrane protein n=1 Tax=Mycolicibacterium brumae TaxID=85968 RepID=A0A2G5P9T2_9MYCO|nr:TVP38/TMEM64 family protein [Mycolicibacterium brumae]PIB75121.1 TVP38/TMEM64 family protein [Mycolicibacterium brumae]
MRTVIPTLRSVISGVPPRRVVFTSIVLVALVAVVLLAPMPSAVQVRDWAQSAGPWLPLVFLGTHALVTIFPFPRTAFTLSAGLLFGSALGVGVAVTAATISAVAALLLVRAFGWRIEGPRVDSINNHLSRRGWPAVLSLRLIPAVPFSVINYAAGASSVRVVPYTLATVFGLLPGTAAVVVLGDALTGTVSPLLLLVSACTASVGIAGLVYEWRVHHRHHLAQLSHDETAAGEVDAPAS